jgi:hypothetical protein
MILRAHASTSMANKVTPPSYANGRRNTQASTTLRTASCRVQQPRLIRVARTAGWPELARASTAARASRCPMRARRFRH